MTLAHLAISVSLALVAAALFAVARRATDGVAERRARLAGTLFSVGALAFAVAAGLSFVTGAGR